MTIQLSFNDPFGMVTTSDWDQLFSLWMTWIPMVQCWFTIWVHRWKCNKMVLRKQKSISCIYTTQNTQIISERFYGKESWRNACSKLKIYKGWKLVAAAKNHSSVTARLAPMTSTQFTSLSTFWATANWSDETCEAWMTMIRTTKIRTSDEMAMIEEETLSLP